MLPIRYSWWHTMVMLSIVAGFIKIYQHNLMVQTSYQKQRLEKQRHTLEKERNDVYAQRAILLDPERVIGNVQQRLGMQALSMEQLLLDVQDERLDRHTTHTALLVLTNAPSYQALIPQNQEAVHVNA